MAGLIVVHLNARLLPLHRGEIFEDPLDDELERLQLGSVQGGGTLQSANGEVESCDIDVEIDGDTALTDVTSFLIATMEKLGAPKGSKLIIEDEDRHVPFGQAEGLAIYLNGTDLSDEVYAQSDSNFVYAELDRLTEGEGRVYSCWEGPTETAFYLYGRSFDEMKARITPLIDTYPGCQLCRVVQIC